ncbi:hypothetical protein DPEC_G00105690 [Dallia pectoralis]|uniref:Uncharacterized protein n=1 Tax=Dallia pectoralis TaxID=75939 RepID=A0ACC2GXV9_DALPE|nr:hypothetical protein DPEC_G00105690 [Dallia pectoralis]
MAILQTHMGPPALLQMPPHTPAPLPLLLTPLWTAQAVTPPSTIRCGVCKSAINVMGRTHLIVVKCGVCNEVTSIKEAPAGKRFVRCLCNGLLVCNVSCQRIVCPRLSCQRIINLDMGQESGSAGSNSPEAQHRAQVRLLCANCNSIFLRSAIPRTAFGICPHCRTLHCGNMGVWPGKQDDLTLLGLYGCFDSLSPGDNYLLLFEESPTPT